MGLNDSAVKWLNSYLSQRTQQAKFRKVTSRGIEIYSGVSQGTRFFLPVN